MIGIIGAMDSEVEALFNNMTEKETVKVSDVVFYKGKLCNKDVVIVKCGIGTVNAALCTQLMIMKFNPDKIINSGIAGATGKGLNIYDFVVSTETVYHDFDTTFFGYKLGQIPGMPETFKADPVLVDLVCKAFNKTSYSKNHSIQKGLIASGNQFIAGGDKKKFIVENFAPACVEMEGCAIAHTCFKNNVPFVIIRCMSDCADDTVQTSYNEDEASKASSGFLMEVMSEL